MKLSNRELEVMGILGATERDLMITEIVNAGPELTQSTVQCVLRKLLSAGYVEAVGVTHSGNVLSRTFALTDQAKPALLEDLANHCRKISGAVSVREIIEALQQLDGGQTGDRL